MTRPTDRKPSRSHALDAWGPRTRWLPVLMAFGLAAVLASAVIGLPRVTSETGPTDELVPAQSARAHEFLDEYVQDGRVVRLDQGGDTVSEGQAYAMLMAVAVGDEEAFAEIWKWTRRHLMRPDGLLSWRWADGAVPDESSASDADLDAARALVLAADTFREDSYAEAGVELGAAVLNHETVQTEQGRVLVAGQWALTAPYAFNPSYVSPVATRLLEEASDDARWAELEEGSRAAVAEVTAPGQLPPDWAQLADDGSVTPAGGPGGQPVRYGYDAARTLIRHAESCEEADRAYAASAVQALDEELPVAIYDLAGSPQTSVESSLSTLAHAAALAAAGRHHQASTAVDAGIAISDRYPTYYGDAWAALGPILLHSDVLGGCPVLEGASP